MKKQPNKPVESNLKKLGLPGSYIGITALVVYYACNTLGACA